MTLISHCGPLEQSCPAKVMVVVASLDLLNIGHQVPPDGNQASIHVATHPYGFGSLLNEFEEVVSIGLKSRSSDFNLNLKPLCRLVRSCFLNLGFSLLTSLPKIAKTSVISVLKAIMALTNNWRLGKVRLLDGINNFQMSSLLYFPITQECPPHQLTKSDFRS